MALNPGHTLLNGHYRIVRLLGRGGFGSVYEARDTLLNEKVAIKELIPALVGDEAMLKRFLAEARATMRLTHKHIVRTHNIFQQGENYYIVMEHMAGGSLEERLRESGALPVDKAVRVAVEVCEGLGCAHEQQVVHCDLKPANILFDASGRAKVADFGIAHVSGEMLTRSWMTPAGFVAGTLPYMSPEQTDGVRDEPRIDIYALGAVLYRALTGQTYLAFDPQETPRAQAENVGRIYSESPLPPSHHNRAVPAWLDGVVHRALAKQPEERYVSAEAMRAALLRQQPAPALAASPVLAPATQLTPDQRAADATPLPTRQAPPAPGMQAVPAKKKKGPLPAWFWPAAGAAIVLLVVLVIAVGALVGGEDGKTVAGVVATDEATATDVPPADVAPAEVPPTEVPSTEAPPVPSELVIGISLDVESMDPFFVNQAAGWSVVHALFDHLIERDFEGDIVPGLASSWTIVGTSTLEFQLRDDVTFHNGEPFTAESVKFSVERMLADEEAPNQGRFTTIDSVEVVDDYTVRLNLNRPDGTLFDSLTSRLAMLPPAYFEEVGAEGFAQAPVGTGPFSFVEWMPDDHVTLVANEDYWEGSYKGKPQVDTVIFRPIPEAAIRMAELQAGGVDIIQDVLPDQIDDIESAGLVVVPDEAFQLQYVFFTTDDEEAPTYNVKVRQALNYAVDVDAIIENLLAGLGSRIASPIGPGYLGYNPDVEPYPYDPVKAKELLEEAGFADGFETTLDVTTAGHTDVIDAVAGYLSEVGVEVTIQDFELGQFNQNWMDHAQSMLWAARWGNTPDPQSIELFASCSGWITRYCNEQVTGHLGAARETLDQDERAEHYAAASQLMHDDPLAIYMNTAAQIYGMGTAVENFRPSPLLAIIVSGISVPE